MDETIFGWCYVNTVSGDLILNIDDTRRDTAERELKMASDRDKERARKLPKGSDLAAAMRRRADAYRLAKIVAVAG